MTGLAGRQLDPVEDQIEAALEPGSFVSYRACWPFLEGLDEVAAEVAGLVDTAPARAVTLYETFLAGCHEKAEEVDDSGGGFGLFVGELFCGWIRARQAAGGDPAQTAARLVAWMDEDPYGFWHGLERDVLTALDRSGRAALTEQVRARFEQAREANQSSAEGLPGWPVRRWAALLRTIHLARRSVGAYIQLAEETGLTAADCHAVATMLSARGKREQALEWVERGLAFDQHARHGSAAGHDLHTLRVRLLGRLGRSDEALQVIWAAFREHPNRYRYDDLMTMVQPAERRAWHEQAIDAATSARLGPLVDLLVHTSETERLAEVLARSSDEALEQVAGSPAVEAARHLDTADPAGAARLWRALAVRILEDGKSKYYGTALRNLGWARDCYERAGCAADWQQLVSDVRAAHGRKWSFMPAFEDLVGRVEPGEEPSFLDRARARWATPAPDAERDV